MKRHGMTYARLLADAHRGPGDRPCRSCLGNRSQCSTCGGTDCACVRQIGAVLARHSTACTRCHGTGVEPVV